MAAVPSVTVIMPVFNAERFLAEAIESILGQTFRDHELVIVDDASTDKSRSIIADFAKQDQRIRPYFQEQNSGAIGARNFALSVARSNVVANMDADDVSLPDRLARQLEYLQANPTLGAVGCQVQVIDGAGSRGAVKHYPTSPTLTAWSLLFFNSLAHPTVMMRRDAVLTVGAYEESSRGTWVEDYSLFTRMSRKYAIANLPEVLLEYRQTASNTTSRYWHIQEVEANRIVQNSVLFFTGTDIGLEGAQAMRGLSTGAYPSTPASIVWLANIIRSLCSEFVRRHHLTPGQRREVEDDAAVKEFLLGAIALRLRPALGVKLMAQAVRQNPKAPIVFLRKVWQHFR
jgi:glycosyltransferase involved in cell wall biosynthesis